jgi:hypothetical protein
MSPLWEFFITLGAWAQSHQLLMIAGWAVVVVFGGGRELARFLTRRKSS